MSEVVWGRCPTCGEPSFLEVDQTRRTPVEHDCKPRPTRPAPPRLKIPAGFALVHHGTAAPFADEIRAHGLRSRAGVGVRVVEDPALAERHARAWCAFLMATRLLGPNGLIASAIIARWRITRDRYDEKVLRVPMGISPQEIRFTRRRYNRLFDPGQAMLALEDHERLVDKRRNVRLAGGVRRS